MNININCKYNDRGAWCTNKNIKRGFFARCCMEYPPNSKRCPLKERFPRPINPPLAPKRK